MKITDSVVKMPSTNVTIFDGHSGDVSDRKFAVVVSTYNQAVTANLLSGALETLAAAGVPDEAVVAVWVPGAWELALAAKRLLDHHDAVICLGAVIRGETTHDQYINSMISNTLGAMSVEYQKPVAFGVLTCNTVEQAVARSGGDVGNKGHEAASAAIEMLRLFQHFE